MNTYQIVIRERGVDIPVLVSAPSASSALIFTSMIHNGTAIAVQRIAA
jgi:hypothetical protein